MPPHDKTHAVILFSHGSRDPLWAAPLQAVHDRIAAQRPDVGIWSAYLELCPPDLPTTTAAAVAAGFQTITIVPMFLGTGKHARDDLPRLVQSLREQHPGVHIHVQRAVGEDPRMTALMADIACEPPPGHGPDTAQT